MTVDSEEAHVMAGTPCCTARSVAAAVVLDLVVTEVDESGMKINSEGRSGHVIEVDAKRAGLIAKCGVVYSGGTRGSS